MVGLVGLLVDRTDETSARAAGTSTSAPSTSVASATVAPAPSLSTTSTLAPVESPAEFLGSARRGLPQRRRRLPRLPLNPAVIERFGEEACRANLTFTPDPTAAFTVKSVSAPQPYDYKTDTRTTTVPNTLFVDVDQVGGGSTQAVTVHLTPVDGKLTWFRNCA